MTFGSLLFLSGAPGDQGNWAGLSYKVRWFYWEGRREKIELIGKKVWPGIEPGTTDLKSKTFPLHHLALLYTIIEIQDLYF